MNFLKKITEGVANYKKFSELNKRNFPIGFYSEMGTDRIYFENIIRRLVEEYRQPVLYLTSSDKDPMLAYGHRDFHAVNIGSGTGRNAAFRELNTKLFVMTLPDLESFELKRSIHPVHYIYIFHSLVSTHMIYRDKAFDAYDTIFCVGPHHELEIRENEQLFDLQAKAFVKHGYPRIDKIMRDYQAYQAGAPAASSERNVLIAPSWGPHSITEMCLMPLIKILLENNYEVTFRPHPMTLRDARRFVDEAEKRFGTNSLFHLDLDISQTDTLFKADVMISDWSGVALEFGLATEKPVLFIDIPRKMNNRNFDQFKRTPVEVSVREQLGAVVSPEQLESIPVTVAEILSDMSSRKQTIAELRNQIIYNIGHSDEVGAREIMRILQEINGPAPQPAAVNS